ncbi:EAL domain-containing response regulator [Pseudomonas sp. UBA4194]|uniref:EAL domain-containing response regulator n=1 Tax=Pseudomonas sp. UBA4194 TaxID=1947317 RepID=UPI0025EA16C0|nr:EAL domain-containing response regulator [Pseudomonas sp. UBA4194]
MSAIKTSVLLVESHGFQRAIAAQMLEQLGCGPIHQAQTGEEALQLLRKHRGIAVLVCNVDILGVDALAVIQQAAAQQLVKAVLISGGLDAEVRTGITQWVSMLGLEYLGDAGSPVEFDKLHRYLKTLGLPRPPQPPLTEVPLLPPDDVQRGLAADEFFACFLPRCNVGDGRIKSVDVKLHWQHPEHGVLTMMQFWAAVERDGLANQLLLHMSSQALKVQQAFVAEGLLVGLSIGIRLEQLGHRKLMSELLEMIRKHLANNRRVALELSHVGLARPQPEYLETLLRVRLMGCDLGMQGFGSGGASLQRLCQWPINQLRLASPFLLEAPHQSRHLAVVQHTLVAARTLGIELTVTGVQTSVHHLLLYDLGCLRGQGDYFAGALTAEELRERLLRPKVIEPIWRG